MSRRRRAETRKVLPDPKYGDIVVTKFMNYVMYEGKKAVAESILYGAFDIVESKRRDVGPLEAFHAALDNVAPSVEVRSRRVGGATYQVPVEVRPERRRALAIRWLVGAARSTAPSARNRFRRTCPAAAAPKPARSCPTRSLVTSSSPSS